MPDPHRRLIDRFQHTMSTGATRLWSWCCVLALSLVLAPGSASAEKVYHFFSAGYGKRTCYEYLAASEGLDPSKFNNKTIDGHAFVSENLAFDEWIYGYFTAMNFDSAIGGNKRPDVETQTAELITWTRDWCRTRPNATVFEGIKHFMGEHWHPVVVAPQTTNEAAPPQPAPSQAAATDPMFVYVTFQDDASGDDRNAFLQAYGVFIADGPTAAGVYKLRLSAPLPPDQLEQVLASMRSQIKVIKTAAAS